MFATEDAAAAVRVAAVSAIDLVLVDLGLGVLLPVPPGERRRDDPASTACRLRGRRLRDPAPAPARPEGPAPDRDAATAAERPTSRCRRAASRSSGSCRARRTPRGLVDGLADVFADAHAREAEATRCRRVARGRGAAPAPPPLAAVREHPGPAAHGPRGGSRPAARRALVDCLVRHGFTVYEAGTRRGRAAASPSRGVRGSCDGDAARRRERPRVLPPGAGPQPAAPHAGGVPVRAGRLREPPPGAQGGGGRLPGEARALARAPGPARAGAAPLRRDRPGRRGGACCAERSS